VSQSVCVPLSILFEDENLFGFLISENHVRIIKIHAPEKLASNKISIDFLKVRDVNIHSFSFAKERSFVEHNLFSVRQEFSMEGKVVHHSVFPRQGETSI